MTTTLKGVGFADLCSQPDEYVDILTHQLLANGEGELSAGDTYVYSFYPIAPNADERHKCLQFGAEEIDHYRRFARLLEGIGVDVADMLNKPVSEREFFPAESMTTTFETWEERAAFSFLCELEGHYQIKEMTTSSFVPLIDEAKSILKEEAGHFAHGLRLMREAASHPDRKRRAQEALNRFYGMALDMFGRSTSKRSAAAVRWGLRQHTNGELRDIYRNDIAGQISRLGYDQPPDDPTVRSFL